MYRCENRNAICTSWSNSEICDPFDSQFIPDRAQISTLVKLNLVRHRSGAILFIVSVLQIPIGLRFLNEFPHQALLFSTILRMLLINGLPDLKILDRIAILVLQRLLPGDYICTERGKSKFKDFGRIERRDNVPNRCIDDKNSVPVSALAILNSFLVYLTVQVLPRRNTVHMASMQSYEDGLLV